MAGETPQVFDIVKIGDSNQTRSLELAGAEGVVLGRSEDEETHEQWFAVQVGRLDAVMLPLGDLTGTGRSVPGRSVYPGGRLRLSDKGRIVSGLMGKDDVIEQVNATLYLINDDEPKRFAARILTVVRDDLRVGTQPAVVVRIEPPIENTVGGPLATAILVAKSHGDHPGTLFGRETAWPVRVFVCRFAGDPRELNRDLEGGEVPMVFWGLVSNSLDFAH